MWLLTHFLSFLSHSYFSPRVSWACLGKPQPYFLLHEPLFSADKIYWKWSIHSEILLMSNSHMILGPIARLSHKAQTQSQFNFYWLRIIIDLCFQSYISRLVSISFLLYLFPNWSFFSLSRRVSVSYFTPLYKLTEVANGTKILLSTLYHQSYTFCLVWLIICFPN